MIELLIAIAIVAFLFVAVTVALNPAKRIQDAKDDTRRIDIDSILTAIHSYTVDHKGAIPTGLEKGMVEKHLGVGTTNCAIATNGCSVSSDTACIDLSTTLAPYLKTIPVDPDGNSSLTRYTVQVDSNGLVTIRSCGAEEVADLSVSR